MTTNSSTMRWAFTMAVLGGSLIGASAIFITGSTDADASTPWHSWRGKRPDACHDCDGSDVGGAWLWMRSPEEEKRVVMGLYSRYCIRCHGIDGRGVWDIPGVPDFTNTRWQASRPDDRQLARIIIEGRGAVMPQFRGTLSLEEACAMARHLRTFVPGTEVLRPEFGTPAPKVPDTKVPDTKVPGKLELPKDKK